MEEKYDNFVIVDDFAIVDDFVIVDGGDVKNVINIPNDAVYLSGGPNKIYTSMKHHYNNAIHYYNNGLDPEESLKVISSVTSIIPNSVLSMIENYAKDE